MRALLLLAALLALLVAPTGGQDLCPLSCYYDANLKELEWCLQLPEEDDMVPRKNLLRCSSCQQRAANREQVLQKCKRLRPSLPLTPVLVRIRPASAP